MGGQPLDMMQYPKLFCSSRIPHPQRDYSYIAPKGEVKHITVAYRSQVGRNTVEYTIFGSCLLKEIIYQEDIK